jgi:hypothetical protein
MLIFLLDLHQPQSRRGNIEVEWQTLELRCVALTPIQQVANKGHFLRALRVSGAGSAVLPI